MKLLALTAVAALALAGSASAATYQFTLTGDHDTASFQLNSQPSGTYEPNGGVPYFEVANVSGVYLGDGSAGPTGTEVGPDLIGNIQFYGAADGGGFGVNKSSGYGIFSLVGPQIYTGSLQAPVFTAGSYDFTEDFFYGRVNEHLQISEVVPGVSAAPEPGAWALMLGGVAMLGAMLRVRKARRDEDAVSDIATA